jgi:hypothetical protein
LMMADTSFMTSPPEYAHRLASAREDVKRGGEKMARRETRRALRNRRDTDAAGGGT